MGPAEALRQDIFRTNARRRAISAALETYEVAFFREVLLGEDGPLRALLGRDDQNVRWISSTSAAPGTARPRQ